MNRTVALAAALVALPALAWGQAYPFPNARYAGEVGTGAPSLSDQILVQQGVTSGAPVGSPARMTLQTLAGVLSSKISIHLNVGIAPLDGEGGNLVATANGGGAGATVSRYNGGGTFGALFASLLTNSTTYGLHGAVASGNTLGSWMASGDDGTNFTTVATAISAQVDGAVSAGAIPARLVFKTSDVSGNLLQGLKIDSSQNATFSAGAILAQTTVAALPTCTSALKGDLRGVTDATAPTYNGTLTGGGAVAIPVYCNGSAWTAH